MDKNVVPCQNEFDLTADESDSSGQRLPEAHILSASTSRRFDSMHSLYQALLTQHARQLTSVRCAEQTIAQLHRYFEDVVGRGPRGLVRELGRRDLGGGVGRSGRSRALRATSTPRRGA